jgi:uncharacterized radical SAM protein YgiQ
MNQDYSKRQTLDSSGKAHLTSSSDFRPSDFLPTTKKEMEFRGWSEVDVVVFSGDAYVDHPSFGAALIGRLLEAQGLKVALVPQPDWRGDHRDFTKMGRPRLFFGVTAGNMDSMVNHYTAGKRLRSDDSYTADAKAGARPDYATIVYSNILRELYPDTPILIGGIEASMRRLTHYDYWSDALKSSILVESKADLLVYGMGEKPLLEICARLREVPADQTLQRADFERFHSIRQTVFLRSIESENEDTVIESIRLYSHEEVLMSKRKQAENFRHIEEESNKMNAQVLVQSIGNLEIVVNPPFPPMTTEELDQSYEYPYTRVPHPKYKDKPIPAYEMIKFSVNIHRGCFGGCAFCTISAHQGKFVMNRSLESVLREVRLLTKRADFKGYLSDLGGPSANMYRMEGVNLKICASCKRPSCIYPKVCNNLNIDHRPLLELYRAVDSLPGIKKSFIGSGIRYDILTHALSGSAGENSNPSSAREYLKEVIDNHVSGRLKVAPEHTSDVVLSVMRKPSFDQFKQFNQLFDTLESKRTTASGRQQLIPYFISSHPGCTDRDMAALADETRKLDFKLEQVQDFTPTPMTLATEIYYTGLHPYTLEPIFTAKTKQEKEKQRSYFFWYKEQNSNQRRR